MKTRSYLTMEQFTDNSGKVLTENLSVNINLPTLYRGNCSVMSLMALYEYSSRNKFPYGISKLIHYFSKEEDVSVKCEETYKTCGQMNDNIQFVLWTDASFDKLLMKKFDRKAIRKWKEIFPQLDDSTKSTLAKIFVLFTFGGLSLSMDTQCQKPLTEENITTNCFVSVGYKMPETIKMKGNNEFNGGKEFGESLIGCSAKHKFLEILINNPLNLTVNGFYMTKYVEYYQNFQTENPIDVLNTTIAAQNFSTTEMSEMCENEKSSKKISLACNVLNRPSNDVRKPALLHEPNYGLFSVQAEVNDICSSGIRTFIII